MKKLISALMLTALASGALAMNEGQAFAATHRSSKARHSSVISRKHKARAKKAKKSVGKIHRVRKSRNRKAKGMNPVVNGGGTGLPISQ